MLKHTTAFAFAVGLVLTGCMKKPAGDTTPTGGAGGTGEASGPALAGTMAEAPVYHLGATIKTPLKCSESGYAKFDFPVGQAVKMQVTIEGPAGVCVSASYLKANGGAVDGMMKEMCLDKNPSETWDVQGLEGGSFIQVLEQPACEGASITVTAQ